MQESEVKSESNSVLRNTGVVAALTALSRVLGFLRDLVFADKFGASALTDGFFVAFKIPNLARSLVAEGALTSAFVPAFAAEIADGRSKQEMNDSLRAVALFMAVLTVLLVAVGIVFSSEIVSFVAPGLSGSEIADDTASMLQIMLPFICCISLVAVFNGALNCFGVFGVSSLAQIVMNVCFISGVLVAGYLTATDRAGLEVLCYFIVFGAVLQVATHAPFLWRQDFRFLGRATLRDPILTETCRLMLPAILGTAVYQITVVLNTALASLLPEGSISWLFYADRIFQLPLGIFSIALASVLLPTLAKAGKANAASKTSSALRYIFFLLLPLSAWIFVHAEVLLSLLFERGSFSAESARQSATALRYYAFGLALVSAQMVLARAFIARKDPLTPAYVAAFCLFFALTCSSLLMGEVGSVGLLSDIVGTIRATLPFGFDLKHGGLALSQALTAGLNFSLLLLLALRRDLLTGLGGISRSLISALTTSLCVYCSAMFSNSLELSGAAELLLSILLSALSFSICCYFLKSREFQETLAAILRKPE